ncbi:MAG: hypothetical protein V4736_03635 [Bdellovibrionota bacterium]
MNGQDYDSTTIQTLLEAAAGLTSVYKDLQSKRVIFQGTNLPVAEAVDHIIACLEKDASYLKRLAEICDESKETMKKFD